MFGMSPRLSTQHLALVAALAETGGVGAAAQRLGLTQPAASHRLREAEWRLGAPLARRRGGGIVLTDAGARLAAFAVRYLGELARLERDVEAARTGAVVRIGQATYNRYHWLPPFLDHVAREAPDITIDLSGSASQQPLRALAEGRVDVSLIYARPAAARQFRWRRLGTDPLVAVMAPRHRLAALPHVTSESFGDDRLYLYPFAAEPGFEWEALLGAPTAPFRRVTTMPTPEAVIDLVRAGFGLSFLSRWAVEPECVSGALVARPIGPGGLPLDWWAVTRASDPEDGPAERVVDCFLSHAPPRRTGLERLGFAGAAAGADGTDWT